VLQVIIGRHGVALELQTPGLDSRPAVGIRAAFENPRAARRTSGGLPGGLFGSHRSPGSAIVNLMVQYPTTVDRAFAALADPTRRAVLERLGSGRATISELAEPFGMSLTGMKKHIRLLEEAELVTTEKVGRVRRCMLAPYAFEGISTWLQRLDRFAQVVERTKGAR
jgi:DNA-binding transcriptional ArsR family regulator